MNTKVLGWLALITLLFSGLWLAMLIASLATAGPLDTFEQVLGYVSAGGPLYTLTYLNAALVTVAATAFFAALYRFVNRSTPLGSLVGLMFLPAYAVINLFVYLSQITIVPRLISTLTHPDRAPAAALLLEQMVQAWTESGAAFFNNLAYGLLGIPSILFGMVLWRSSRTLRWGGLLLVLNGIACIVGVVGMLAGSRFLAGGSVVGGVLFIIALPLIAAGMLRE